MRIPVLRGTIKRRILINYSADPAIVSSLLPSGFRPKLVRGKAIAGICLIRLEQVRPRFSPLDCGISSENAAHRFAVEWDENRVVKEGVYIPRRDTDSILNSLAGGRIFSGEHHRAVFDVEEKEGTIDFSMQSEDGKTKVAFSGSRRAGFPKNSIFPTLSQASAFFECGSLGFSPSSTKDSLEGISLKIDDWRVEPFAINSLKSGFFDDRKVFPEGSIKFDHALLMENIEHEWHSAENFALKD
ncbi:MAG: DUF2071 domain-containing protein [Pyrinomonadaceae bacterium]|nr:DUF2071 domain-containing protein [Pyrinomonadaceae bacterium]